MDTLAHFCCELESEKKQYGFQNKIETHNFPYSLRISMLQKLILIFLGCFLFTRSGILAKDISQDTSRIEIAVGIYSAPSLEIRSGLSFEYRFKNQAFRVMLLAPELRQAFKTWSPQDADEASQKIAWGLGHRYRLWERGNWSFYSNTMFQIQGIHVHTTNSLDPAEQTILRTYPRIQLSTGLGIGFLLLKRIQISQSIRYGIARGNFFPEYMVTEHWRANICADISIGVKL